MNKKRLIGFAMIAVGIYLIFYALDAMHQIKEAKGTIGKVEDFFTNSTFWNPIITFFGGKARQEASSYDLPALLTLIAGIALAVSGTVVGVLTKKRKK
jgi:hypothetical protein